MQPLDIKYWMVFYLLSRIVIVLLAYICIMLYRYPNLRNNNEIPFIIIFIAIFCVQNHILYNLYISESESESESESFDNKGIANDVKQINEIDVNWNPQFPFIKTHINYINNQLADISNNTKLMQYTNITTS